MNMFKLIEGLKEKLVKPRVYSLLLKFPNASFMHISAAYSLEDAFSNAKQEFAKKFPNIPLVDMSISLFDHKSFEDLVEPFTGRLRERAAAPQVHRAPSQMTPVAPTPPKEMHPVFDKLKIMQEIVKTKDKALLELHRKDLSENEQKYLEDKIKSK